LTKLLAPMQCRNCPKTNSKSVQANKIEWELVPYSFTLTWVEIEDPSNGVDTLTRGTLPAKLPKVVSRRKPYVERGNPKAASPKTQF
jgi:hypothetical protein